MKILICDDHKIVRDGLKQILQQSEEVKAIDEANDGAEALNLVRDNDYDVILLDISLPGRNGLEVLRSIKQRSSSSRVLMLSMHPQEQYVKSALSSGASGYLTKDSASEELLLAIKRIHEGKKYIAQSLAENLAFSFISEKDNEKQLHELLSEREFEIMLKIARGMSLIDIGNQLFISVKTVSTYRTRIMAKMQMLKNADLTLYCYNHGLI